MKIYIKSTTKAREPVISELKSYLKGPADLAAQLLIDRVTKEDISDDRLAEAVNSLDLSISVCDIVSDKLGVCPKVYSPSGSSVEIVNLPGTSYTRINSSDTDINSYANDWVAEFTQFCKKNYKSTIISKRKLTLAPNEYIDKVFQYITNNVYEVTDENKLRKAIREVITPTYRRNNR